MLMETALRRASECGFREIRLSTAAVLKEALGLYGSAGFALEDGPLTCKNCNIVMSKRLG
jgi:ribosomal protein S18 acetylase RimI-like enzyme